MKKFLSFIAALTISATSMADITASEIQQALHALQPVTDTPVASDHVFTCRDRFIVRCDADNNIFQLTLTIDTPSQLNVDLSVFTYLQRYYLTAEANIEQLPIGLTNLSTLNSVTFDADTFALPEIDGAAFPENLSFLSIATSQHAIKLKSWQTHQLATLTLNGAEVDFNNTAFPNLVKLDLAKTPLLKNYDFTDFAKVTNFSWQYQYEQNPTIYHTTRAQFPLLLSEAVEINLNRQHREPKLTEIPSYILTIPNLQSLTITDHAITEIPEALLLMPALKYLDVSHNMIATLPTLSESSNLEYLSLANNQFTHIPETLYQLTQLKQLDIAANDINVLPTELFSMPSLQVLDASRNTIQALPIINSTSGLQSLTLKENKLAQVPAELFQLENLLILDLRNNQITSLPEIPAGSRLQKLYLHINKLTTLPVSLFNHLSLEELRATSNQLSSLPEGIVNNSLLLLDFSNNNFVQIPDALSQFSKLKTAIFQSNKIKTLGEQWKQNPTLETLMVNNNQLSVLTAEMLNKLPASLKKLSLNKNKMAGELPEFTKVNPELSLDIGNNALWSSDKNTLLQYADVDVLKDQLLPVRGVHVIEKQVNDDLVSYIQWGFPLMEDINGRTSGTHAFNNSFFLNVPFINADINPGPNISTGYELVIEYTQGKNAGKIITVSFTCETLLSVTFCVHLNDFSSSYDTDTYSSSIFSYRLKGSLEGAKITVYSTTPHHKGLLSSPTYWGSTGKHEQFLDEIKYEDALLPIPEAGSIYYYHLLVLLLIALIRVRKANSAVTA